MNEWIHLVFLARTVLGSAMGSWEGRDDVRRWSFEKPLNWLHASPEGMCDCSVKTVSAGIVFCVTKSVGLQDLTRTCCLVPPEWASTLLTSSRDRPSLCAARSWGLRNVSCISSCLNLTASPWAALGLGPGTDEGLASLPSCHRPAGWAERQPQLFCLLPPYW